MAIDKETNKSVGGGGGIDIESTDQSITITETEPGKKDLSVNWGDMPGTVITSPDSSVNVTETDKNTFELSVPLATEERNGLLSAVGKYQNDHSQLIETTEQAETANIAAGLLMNKDLEFYPEEGQMMTWKDTNGKLHLSRYEPNTAKNNGFIPSNWRTAVYDAVAESIIVESKSGDTVEPAAGQFRVAQSFNGGWTWTNYLDTTSPNENWGIGTAYKGTAVFISRNSSQEIEYSTDGGVTWTRANLPSKKRWNSVWVDENERFCFHSESNEVVATADFSIFTDVSADYPAGCRCYFLPEDPTRYPYANKTSNWVCIVRESVFGMQQNVIYQKGPNGWFKWYTMGTGQEITRHFPIKIQYEAADGTITMEPADLFVNDEMRAYAPILYINSNDRYYLWSDQTDWWVFPILYSKKENKVFAIVSNDDKIYQAVGPIPQSGTGLQLSKTETIINGTQAVNFIPYGEDSIFTFGGVKHDDSGFRQSDFNLFLTISGKTVISTPPDFWREIPLIDENKNGLLLQEGNTVNTAELGDFLEKRTVGANTEIGTVHSDRITEYANYMLQNSNGVCWCMVDVADMVDNTTKVYSDEECTTEIGVVTNHSYNPHNPLDVEVNIGGTTEVYVIDPTKIPQSLATTAALIAARVEINNLLAELNYLRAEIGHEKITEEYTPDDFDVENTVIRASDGEGFQFTGWNSTSWVFIEGVSHLIVKMGPGATGGIAFYNAQKQYISGTQSYNENTETEITIPSNAFYMRTCIKMSNPNQYFKLIYDSEGLYKKNDDLDAAKLGYWTGTTANLPPTGSREANKLYITTD